MEKIPREGTGILLLLLPFPIKKNNNHFLLDFHLTRWQKSTWNEHDKSLCAQTLTNSCIGFFLEKKYLAFHISGKSVAWISSCLLLYAYRDVIVLTRGICSLITFYLIWKSINWGLKLQWTLLNIFLLPTDCLKCTVVLLCCCKRDERFRSSNLSKRQQAHADLERVLSHL